MKNNVTIPLGVIFKFAVTPSINKYHQEGIRYYIIKESGLSQYYTNIEVEFFDGCYTDKNGESITDDKLNGKQMQVKVFCPEAIIAIESNNEAEFYKQIEEKFSNWIIDLIQSNEQTSYLARLGAFLCTKRLI